MDIPPESPSFAEDEMQATAQALKWQAASARAAGAKHRARLVDQLESLPDDRPDEAGPSPD